MRKYPKLRTLLIVPTSFLFLLMVGGLALSAFFIYSSNVRNSSYTQMEATSEQVLRNYETYFDSAVQVSDGIYSKYATLSPLDSGELTDYFDTLIELKPEILSISVYNASNGEPIARDSNSYFIYDIMDSDWFLGALEDPYINVFTRGFSDGVPYSFILSRYLVSDVEGGIDAVAKIDFDFSQIVETISPVSLGEGGRFIIYDRDYRTIYASNESSLDEAYSYIHRLVLGSTTVNLEGHSFYLYCMTISNTTWRVAIFINVDSLTTAISTFAWSISLVALAAIIIYLVFASLLASRITKPILLLQREMSRVEGLEYEAYLSTGISGSREVNELSRSFENMMKRIRQLMDDVVKEKEEQKRSELKALQNQIPVVAAGLRQAVLCR